MQTKAIAENLPGSAQSFFKDDLGFPLQKLSDQPVTAEKFLGEHFRPERHRKIERIFLTGYVGDESMGNADDLASSKKRYKGMLLLSVELNTHSPTYTEIGLLTSSINRVTPALPVAVLYSYNKGARMALSSCERFEYKKEFRIGERTGKTASLIDINIRKPSRAHQDLLGSLHLNQLSGAGDIETILSEWRERLRGSDRSLLTEIVREYMSENRAFPPLGQFDEIFGQEAVATIRNTQGWGCYHYFLKESVAEDAQLGELLESSVIEHVSRQIKLFQERHGIKPTPRIIQLQNRHRDLLFFGESNAEAFLKKAEGAEKRRKSLREEIHFIRESVIGKAVSEDEDNDEELEDCDPTWENGLPVITVSEDALEVGEYDDLEFSPYSIPKEYRKLVFDYLPQHCSYKTIGHIRGLSPEDAQNFKSFGTNRYEALRAIRSGILEITKKALFEREIDRQLEDYADDELDFTIDDTLTPRWLMPVGKGNGNSILKILRQNHYDPTALNLKRLSLGEFSNFKSINQNRIEEYIRLKLSLPKIVETKKGMDLLSDKSGSDEVIDPRHLDDWEQVAVDRIFWITRDTRLRIKHLFLDYEDKFLLRDVPQKWNLSRHDVWRLALIRQKVALALQRENRNVYIASGNTPCSLPELDSELIEYLRRWLSAPVFRCNDMLKKYIFLVRNGIGEEKLTLRKIGDLGLLKENSNVCRERIRQLEAEASKRFICSLPFHEEEISRLIANKTPDTLPTELPHLFNLLGSDKRLLQRFMGLIAGNPSLFLNIEESVLDVFFAQTPQPVTRHQVIKFISESLDEDDLVMVEDRVDKPEVANEVFETLALRNIIEFKGERVLPRQLHPKEGIAHIMASEPAGLHIKDIIGILEQLDYCREKELSFGRLKQLGTDPYLYLGGTFGAGTVSVHKKFLPDVEESELEKLAEWIQKKIAAQPDKREDLRTIHHESPIGRDWDYHVFRFYVRDLSEDHPFNFDGKSRADNVALEDAGEKRIGNEERVFRLIDQARNGITLNELVQNFHCKSSALINLHLNELLSKGKVMKLTPRLYGTEKKIKKLLAPDEAEAYKSIPKTLRRLLDECEDTGRILDTRLVCQEVNRSSLTDLSPSLVHSRVSREAHSQGWYISHSLVSRNKLKYNSLTDIYLQECAPDMSLNPAMKTVGKEVAATESALKNTYYNFRLSTGVAESRPEITNAGEL